MKTQTQTEHKTFTDGSNLYCEVCAEFCGELEVFPYEDVCCNCGRETDSLELPEGISEETHFFNSGSGDWEVRK